MTLHSLHWLPPARDFRASLAAARAAPPEERMAALAALAGTRLGFLETIQLDRALVQAADADAPGMLRLAAIGSATLDHLLPAIRVAALRRGLHLAARAGGFGLYRQEVLDPGSWLHAYRPHAVLLSLGAADLVGAVRLDAEAAEAAEAVGAAVGGLRALWRALRASGATVVQQEVLDIAPVLFGSYDARVPGSPGSLAARLNAALAEAAAEDGVLWLGLARHGGAQGWFDVSRWLQAKQEIAPQAAPAYGELVARLLAAARGLSRKCLVLDLDNTLWGGVIGDDGPEGILLGQGSALGEAHLALQRYAQALKARGVILAVCSKNEPEVAQAVFRDHPEMALRLDDIAVFVANWQDKAANLRAIAARLNIGIDSLVFVDDNPVERARVREALPMVAVPELADDAALYVSALADAGYFEAVAFTAEDTRRAEQYAENARREAAQDSAGSVEDFLAGLGMEMQAGRVTPADLPRVTQLINKTNQFNPTTRRFSADEVTAACSDGLALQFRLRDRFGDNGLVSAMLLSPAADRPGTLDVDAWVMSCRVFGRQLEQAAMNVAVAAARAAGARALRAEYLPTAKNAVVRDLYPGLGFRDITDTAAAGNGTRWLLELDAYADLPTHITRTRPEP